MSPSKKAPPAPPLRTRRAILKVVAVYAIFAALWILLSDKAVSLFLNDLSTITLVSTLKGWVFVAITSLLLYILVRRLIDETHFISLREREARTENARTGQLLAAIVESSSDAIFIKDRNGRYLLFNREAARITGTIPESVIGKDDWAIFPPAEAEVVRANDNHAIAENKSNTYEEKLSTVDGKRTFLATKGPLHNADGSIFGTYGISRDITERKQAEEALRKSEANFRDFFEKNSSVMLIVDPISGNIVDANMAATAYYGYTEEHLRHMSINDINVLPPEQVIEQRQRASRGECQTFIFPHRLASGKIRQVEAHITPVDRDGRPLLLSIIHDITDRILAEAALRESEERLRLAFTASNQGWFDIDIPSGKVNVSPEYVLMIGFDPESFQSTMQHWLDNIHPEDRNALATALHACIEEGGTYTQEYRRKTGSGQWKWLKTIGKVVQWDANHRAIRMIGIHTDITETKQMEDQVRQLAFFDPLTKLPNRRLLNDRLNQAMASSKRSGCYCALMFADLDNFKPLNDTHGHEAGDLLLMEAAERLKGCVREMDTVARFGGDEFIVMICELDVDKTESMLQASIVAEKIRAALAKPYVLAIQHEGEAEITVEHHCSASIGVTLFINHETSQADILKSADSAMYQAKEAGRNSVRFFNPEN